MLEVFVVDLFLCLSGTRSVAIVIPFAKSSSFSREAGLLNLVESAKLY